MTVTVGIGAAGAAIGGAAAGGGGAAGVAATGVGWSVVQAATNRAAEITASEVSREKILILYTPSQAPPVTRIGATLQGAIHGLAIQKAQGNWRSAESLSLLA